MKVLGKYSHLNGEEFLIVHHKKLYKEILEVIKAVDAYKFKTKISEEKGRKKGKIFWNPVELNEEYKKLFNARGWHETRRDFYVSQERKIVEALEPLSFEAQAEYLDKINYPKMHSYNQTDFVKNHVAVEVQLGKYFAVTYDLFVKHLSFFGSGLINIGIEIVPMKSMQNEMSSGPPWFEKEVHNVLRHGRGNPPVPLLILGVAP
ncbi:MAG TPA: BglII/BstYI family type II restriction endonuclease [Elusimicrobiota bacterium]|nr:BglII/BstYI family type II restriction endonuclease [Elusimicrobiota bacterium]